MLKKFANFVLNKPQMINHPLKRASEGGGPVRFTRMRKFNKKGRKLYFAAKLVAIWYLIILTGSYLTSDTGAYFNDVKSISGTISVAEDFCKDVENGSDFWQKYCKDNAGPGNGSDPPDKDNGGKGTDPDNPGQNKGGCDDHTNAPCSEVRDLKEKHTSSSISLTWSNPSQANKNFSHVNVYRNDGENPVGINIKNGKFNDENLVAATKYSYKITTVGNKGIESSGTIIEVTTSSN
ncbi:fibronectin type III domain-containing protein [Bacillus sp. FJAT-27445]|uniref:fibronectin type III domain-containing protein n=1 Tax=Bacillus sp. FJAT-27445 TaxID=1679166 RepID=UPI0007443088|nr:fibronectin type III domain-containing protein [Bacillus sp. FJAT-27445]